VETGKKLSIVPECKLTCKATDYRKAKFNPVNDRQFAILTAKGVLFYSLVEGFEGQIIEGGSPGGGNED
jgi:hypothetical protein